MDVLNIGWFSTGRGTGSQGLLNFIQRRILSGRLEAEIQFVFSNREPGEAEGSDQFFRLVEGYGRPLVTFSSSKFRRQAGGRFADHREEYDGHVMDLLSGYQPDICVLAGYMLIVGGTMCRRYTLLNLHPALPDGPIGAWQEVVWKLIETRASETGAMVHLATEEVDRGPVVTYCTVPLTGPLFDPHWHALHQQDLARIKETEAEEFPLFKVIRDEEYRREPHLLIETLLAVAQGKLSVSHQQVLERAGDSGSWNRSTGLCLDQEIERSMAADADEGAT
ncbi:MAG: hypothetical protein IH962_02395 [Chloroflexi bacterium]|nr:hypothetical protein [Chloroflexota bacterium]